jgi:hypothetical protein
MESGGDSERTALEFWEAMSRVGKNDSDVRVGDGLMKVRNDDTVRLVKQEGEIEIELWKGNLTM